MAFMARTKPPKTDDVPDDGYPSRANYKGTYLPKDIYEELDSYAAADDRSASFLVRRAVERYLIELRKSGPPGPSIRKPKIRKRPH